MHVAKRRPPHAKAHKPCPFDKANWSDCDLAASRQWGLCKAQTGDREPKPCTRYAMDSDGWCAQHFASRVEAERKAAAAAARKAELDARIDAYLAVTAVCPGLHTCPHDGAHPKLRMATRAESTVGLAGVSRVELDRPLLESDRPPRLTPEMAGGAGLEPAITRVTTGGPTTERPAKRKGPHRIG